MTPSKFVAFVAGFLLAVLLTRPAVVSAASQLVFGSYNNRAKAVVVTSSGAVIVAIN